MIKPIEMEYYELVSSPNQHANRRFGIKIQTTPETYEQDLAELVIEVKSKLQMFANEWNKDIKVKK